MILVTCVDDNLGMLFNNRRQSMDSVLRERMIKMCAGHRLWMNAYSRKQFDAAAGGITVDDAFMDKADADDYCFAENISIKPYEKQINKIVLYKWNRVYPADLYFDIDLSGWQLSASSDFAGSSHDKITEEIYVK